MRECLVYTDMFDNVPPGSYGFSADVLKVGTTPPMYSITQATAREHREPVQVSWWSEYRGHVWGVVLLVGLWMVVTAYWPRRLGDGR